MTRGISLFAALMLVLYLVAPAWARTVRIETTVPLADQSEATINRAITQAVETAVRGATAMGLSWIWVDGARVLSNALVVRMIATDDDPDDVQDSGDSGRERL